MKIEITQELSKDIASRAHAIAFNHLNHMMHVYDKKNTGFVWLRTTTTHAGLDDFLFAYKNQVFSVQIRMFWRGTDITSTAMNQDFWELTRDNNIIPCVFPIKLKVDDTTSDKVSYELALMDDTGWNLQNFNTGNPVNPQNFDAIDKVEMSEYELTNFAVRIAANFLEKTKGFKVNSICDTPGILPNIWFSDDKGNTSWVCVGFGYGNANDVHVPDISRLLTSNAKKFDGYFFPVGMQSQDEKLYRASPIHVHYIDIKKIHDAT